MPTFEKNIVKWVGKNSKPIAFLVVVLMSAFIRYKFLPYHTWDMDGFYLPWSEQMRQAGFAFFAQGVGIYSIAMQLMIWVSTIAPIDTATAIKLFSIVGDYLIAWGVALLVYTLREKRGAKPEMWALAAFAAATMMPLPLINSALWGQSDTIYGCFAIFCVYFLVKEKWFLAFILYGVSFSFKLQAILLLPLLVMLYFIAKKFSVIYFTVPFIVLVVTTLPAILQGASPLVGFKIYKELTKYDQAFYINYPGLPALSQSYEIDTYNTPATLLALVVCFAMLAWLLVQKVTVKNEAVVLLGAWSVLMCAFILPGMHERYALIGEVLVWVYFLVKPSKVSLGIAVIFTFTGYCAYASYLFGFFPVQVEYLVVLNLFGLLLLTRELLKNTPAEVQKQNSNRNYVKKATIYKQEQ